MKPCSLGDTGPLRLRGISQKKPKPNSLTQCSCEQSSLCFGGFKQASATPADASCKNSSILEVSRGCGSSPWAEQSLAWQHWFGLFTIKWSFCSVPRGIPCVIEFSDHSLSLPLAILLFPQTLQILPLA